MPADVVTDWEEFVITAEGCRMIRSARVNTDHSSGLARKRGARI